VRGHLEDITMRKRLVLFTALGLAGIAGGCTLDGPLNGGSSEEVGELDVALTNAPSDVSCVKLTLAGSRTDVRTFDLAAGKKASFSLSGLPVGTLSVSADAFPLACNKVIPGADASWYSEPVSAKIKPGAVAHVALAMIHNGKASVAVDFDENNAPTQAAQPGLVGGVFSSAKPYLLPAAASVKVKAILTAGDAVGTKPDGTPYRMVGIPDGTGAFDNGDGTFTYLVNHEIPGSGIARAHGGKGAFVSKWTIRKADLAVLKGEDLGKQVVLWNASTSSYDPPSTGTVFSRFCSADLAAPSAYFDAASGLGYDAPLFLNGEESGVEGRAVGHDLTGNMWELPRLGKMSFENNVANPGTGVTTVVAGTDDGTGGQVYFYVGTKTNAGSAIDKAGLTNGKLYGLKVVGAPVESSAAGIAAGPVELVDLGNVQNTTGAAYFVTTNSFTAPSRLWRVRFVNAANPALGASIEMLLDGTEGQKMFDNMTIDHFGHVYLQEDVGGNVHLGRVLRYDIASDTLTPVLQADPALFDNTIASPTFLTIDEEASGIIDASDLLGPGWFLTAFQAHKSSADPELFEGGQLLAFYDPAATE
jgi:hypothetical protein